MVPKLNLQNKVYKRELHFYSFFFFHVSLPHLIGIHLKKNVMGCPAIVFSSANMYMFMSFLLLNKWVFHYVACFTGPIFFVYVLLFRKVCILVLVLAFLLSLYTRPRSPLVCFLSVGFSYEQYWNEQGASSFSSPALVLIEVMILALSGNISKSPKRIRVV